MKLNPVAARSDLTDRECAKILGGLIGMLADLAPVDNIVAAVHWWAEHEAAIRLLYALKETVGVALSVDKQ